LLVRAGTAAVELPALPVAAVDATGAGDALNGALAAALAAGLDLETAARSAVVAASLSTRVAGARAGLASADELAATLAERPAYAAPTPAAQTEKT
jgi:sugar/nucleoside kinase (ribokinase family)